MSQINYLAIAAREWRTILLLGIAVGIIAAGLSFTRPLEYMSTVRLLIVQRASFGLDPYLAARAQERVSENLASIITTTSFFEKVIAFDEKIDRSYFREREDRRRKQWDRMVDGRVARGSGLLTVRVFHRQKDQAARIAETAAQVLEDEAVNYVGGADLRVQIVDAPLTTNWPVRPNVPLNAFGGFVLGIVVGAAYVAIAAGRHPPHCLHGFLHT